MTAPLRRVVEQDVPAVSTATNDADTILAQAPFDGTVAEVQYVPAAGITGADTNTRTVSLVNRGQDGSGTTVVATLTFASGTNATADNEVTVPVSGVADATNIVEGDTLAWHSAHVGTGMTDPGGLARVTLSRG